MDKIIAGMIEMLKSLKKKGLKKNIDKITTETIAGLENINDIPMESECKMIAYNHLLEKQLIKLNKAKKENESQK